MAKGFEQPVYVLFSKRVGMCVVEQAGRIICEGKTLIDIRKEVRSGGEMGLLSAAFAPDFDQSSDTFLYVNYTVSNGGAIETIVAAIPMRNLQAFSAEKRILLRFSQPFANHNGGLLLFRKDGTLLIGTGDGGSAGDPYGNGQKTNTFLGKILRIQPTPRATNPYQIPPNNPFAKRTGFFPEIYAYGLRNPWRFSLDRLTGDLYVGDVGQNRKEEIDFVQAGDNLGWNKMEADLCYKPENCSRAGLVLPIYSYGRQDGVSLTGGYVYRGKKIPGLVSQYLFADFVTGTIWAFPVRAGKKVGPAVTLISKAGPVSSFGEDLDGEIYVVLYSGEIKRIAP
ncbi:MAG: PQQ-dependent sugar dehydrogenase [Spirochaetia bacterium]|nr:PQQ-dependent sugar dehydrogenase [Spirochaetia bacterium]